MNANEKLLLERITVLAQEIIRVNKVRDPQKRERKSMRYAHGILDVVKLLSYSSGGDAAETGGLKGDRDAEGQDRGRAVGRL